MNNDSILILIKRASHIIRRRLEESLNIASSQIRGMNGLILKYLEEHSDKDVFLTDLEKEFTMRKASLVEIINFLERKGYVRKSSIDGDGRYKKIVITEEGKEFNNTFSEVATAVEEELMGVLTEEEKSAMESGLLKIINFEK